MAIRAEQGTIQIVAQHLQMQIEDLIQQGHPQCAQKLGERQNFQILYYIVRMMPHIINPKASTLNDVPQFNGDIPSNANLFSSKRYTSSSAICCFPKVCWSPTEVSQPAIDSYLYSLCTCYVEHTLTRIVCTAQRDRSNSWQMIVLGMPHHIFRHF